MVCRNCIQLIFSTIFIAISIVWRDKIWSPKELFTCLSGQRLATFIRILCGSVCNFHTNRRLNFICITFFYLFLDYCALNVFIIDVTSNSEACLYCMQVKVKELWYMKSFVELVDTYFTYLLVYFTVNEWWWTKSK